MLELLRGSVRPGLAWAFGLSVIAGFFIGLVPWSEFRIIAEAVILFWFINRLSKPPDGAVPHG